MQWGKPLHTKSARWHGPVTPVVAIKPSLQGTALALLAAASAVLC